MFLFLMTMVVAQPSAIAQNLLGENILITTSHGVQGESVNVPAISFDGINYVIVWEAFRTTETGWDIFGIRLTADGQALHMDGNLAPDTQSAIFPVTTAPGNQRNPAIAFDGTNHFVVWIDDRNTLTGTDTALLGVRIAQSGGRLDTQDIRVGGEFITQQGPPAIIFNGFTFFITWYQHREIGGDIYRARVGSDGTALDPVGDFIAVGIGQETTPAVTFDGTHSFVIWSDGRNKLPTGEELYGTRVSSAGFSLESFGTLLSSSQSGHRAPAVAFDGTNYFVVWEDDRNVATSGIDLYGARITTEHVLLDSVGIPIATNIGGQTQPTIVFDGVHYFVAWSDTRNEGATDIQQDCNPFNNCNADIYGTRVDTLGTALDPDGIGIATSLGYQDMPTLASNGTEVFVTWADWRDPAGVAIYSQRVSAAGTPPQPETVFVGTWTGTWESANPFDVPGVPGGGGPMTIVFTNEQRTDIGTYLLTGTLTMEGSGKEHVVNVTVEDSLGATPEQGFLLISTGEFAQCGFNLIVDNVLSPIHMRGLYHIASLCPGIPSDAGTFDIQKQ